MPFTFEPLVIPDVVHVTPKTFADDRGVFVELFKASEFAAYGLHDLFVQVNHSASKKNVLRGLHYQKNPKAQGKLVSVTRGEIFDVAVDIRRGSPTFGTWVSATLSAEKKNMLLIPTGFAHGFCVTSEEAEVIYYCTSEYAPDHEAGIIWNDPTINISWPVAQPLLSKKDAAFPLLTGADNNFEYRG